MNDANSDVFKVAACLHAQKSDCRVHPVDEEVIQRADFMFPIYPSRSWGSSAHLPVVTAEHPLLQQLQVSSPPPCTAICASLLSLAESAGGAWVCLKERQ